MRTFAQKPNPTQQTTSVKPPIPGGEYFGQSREVNSLLHWNTIGNQGVQEMLETSPKDFEGGLIGTAPPHFGHDFSRIRIHPPAAEAIQTKLTTNKPGDEYEQEADRISEQVMRMPAQPQRACTYSEECQTDQLGHARERLRTKRVGSVDWGQTEVPPIVQEVLHSSGQSIDPATRAFMEPRFGRDFNNVRLHTDAKAADSARVVNALAYTVGTDVVFGTGQYAPGSSEGQRLLAHELAHVVQQSGSDGLRHGRSDERPDLSPILLGSGAKRVYRQAIPAPLEMTTEAEVARVFDMLATTKGVQVATEVNIAVLDEVSNWIVGRIDRIVRLPDGSIKGVELKLDATSSKTAAQVRYIPLANEGSLIEVTGHAADQLGLPQGTRITLRILIVSSESVGEAMEMLGIKPESIPRVIRRAAGSSPPPSQPSAFESAPESFEQVPRSPRAVGPAGEVVPPGAAAESGSAPAALGRRVLAYEAPAASTGSSAVRGATTAAGVAMPVVGIVDELLVGGDMARIRRILSHSFAPSAEEQDFMRSYGLAWNDETFSYNIMSIGWQLYWIGKWILNPMVLNPEPDPNEMQSPA